jgi:hypothetical protein
MPSTLGTTAEEAEDFAEDAEEIEDGHSKTRGRF